MKRLLLRADASTRMGTGHVMRCLALAQAWQDMGGEAALLSRDLPPALAERMLAENIRLLPLSVSSDDESETCKAAAEADWVVLDGYHFGATFCDHVSRAAKHVLLLDDLGQLPRYDAELILNQNITASATLYARRGPGTSLLCGCAFALLRREFRHLPAARNASAPCERLLVTLGGSDPDNVTQKVIGALSALPHLHAKIIVGAANPRRESLKQQCLDNAGRLELLPPVSDMVPLMDWAQFAVSAGGTSVLELASRGVPTLLLAIADNQRAICELMHERGVMFSVGWHEDVTCDTLASTIRLLTSTERRQQRADFSSRGMRLVDGHGALRVAREMMARESTTSVRIRRADRGDARRVFEWANDPVTRSVSFNQSEIPWEGHQAWFAKRLDDPACRLLIGEDAAGVAFGMVRFDLEGASATISINLAPEHRQRGLGTALILVACRELGTTEVKALIKPGNPASQRAFQRAGFRPAPDVDVAGQRALCMVLN